MLNIATTHASLIVRLATPEGGSAAAWREFEERYGELIRSFARRRGLQPADCDDVLQEVLLAVARNVGDGPENGGFRYDPARGKFRSYLKTIAVRAIARRFRQNRGAAVQQTEEQALEVATDPAVETEWEREWRQYHLRMAMRTLRVEFSQTDLAIFEAYAGEGCEAEEVARELDVSLDRIYQAKSRILRRLRQIIAAQIEVEG